MLRPTLTAVRSPLLVALLALGLVVAGCGTDAAPEVAEGEAAEAMDDVDDSGSADDAAADSAQDAATEDTSGSVIAAAVDQSASVATARTRFSVVTETPQGDVERSGEGVSTADSASITLTMSGQMAAWFDTDEVEIEVRILDGMMYQRFPELIERMGSDAEWLSVDLATLGPDFENILEAAQHAAPSESLEVLRDVADITEVGRETVNGTETTHYTGQLDLRALEATDAVPDMLEGAGVDLDQPIPVEAWIDDDGMVRRYDMAMEMQGMTTTMAFDVLEYGIDVEVTAPPAEVTVPFEQLMEQGQQSEQGQVN